MDYEAKRISFVRTSVFEKMTAACTVHGQTISDILWRQCHKKGKCYLNPTCHSTLTIVHAARILNTISSESQTKCGSRPLTSSHLYPILSPLWLPWQQGVGFKQCHCGLKPFTRGERRPHLCLGETRCGRAQSDMYAAALLSPAAASRALLHTYHNQTTANVCHVCFYWENMDP